MAAEQRAARDHRDASKAAQQRYKELVTALSGQPDALPELLAAHAAAGWIPEALSLRSPPAQPAVAQPHAAAPQSQAQQQQQAEPARPMQTADQPEPSVPLRQAQAERQTSPPGKGADLKAEAHSRAERDEGRVSGQREEHHLQHISPNGKKALNTTKGANKPDNEGPREQEDAEELKAAVQRLNEQLNSQHVEAWDAQKKLQKRVETLQARLKVCPVH